MRKQGSLSLAQTQWLDNLAQADHFNRWIFAQIAPHLGDKVLEIGCGIGNFTVHLANHCCHLTVIDLDGDYVAQTRARLHQADHVTFYVGDATQQQWRDRFDTIILLDVLEHIEQDQAFLNQLAGLLKSGGRLILKVPAGQRLYNRLDRSVGHYRRYNKTNLSRTLADGNFTPLDLHYFNIMGIPGWWINGSLLKRTIPGGGQVGLFNHFVPLFQRLEQQLPPPVGLSLMAIATPRMP